MKQFTGEVVESHKTNKIGICLKLKSNKKER